MAPAADVRLGDSLDLGSDMGPLIHQGQYDSVLSDIDRLVSGAGKLMQYTSVPDLPGYFIPPTVVDGCNPSETVEEIFGPVAAVHSFVH